MGWFGLISVILVAMVISTISIWTYMHYIQRAYGISINEHNVEIDTINCSKSFRLNIKTKYDKK